MPFRVRSSSSALNAWVTDEGTQEMGRTGPQPTAHQTYPASGLASLSSSACLLKNLLPSTEMCLSSETGPESWPILQGMGCFFNIDFHLNTEFCSLLDNSTYTRVRSCDKIAIASTTDIHWTSFGRILRMLVSEESRFAFTISHP